MSKPTLLNVKSLSRIYGSHHAVKDLSFSINKGEVLGFLGLNGAGKSTTMKMLSGNLAPSYGEISINGYDLLTQPKQAKAHIGYLPEQPPIYKELTVKEFLSFCAQINQIPSARRKAAISNVVERCGLEEITQRLIGHLSKGFQQRVGIAQAIIHSPTVVILDEPTSGLDPIQIKEIRHLIRDIAFEHSVILSTHILSEVQMLCDRMQIINNGKLIFSGTLAGLGHMQGSNLLVTLNTPPTLVELYSLEGVTAVESISSTQFKLHYKPEHNPTEFLLDQSVKKQWKLTELTPTQHSLEDAFMNIIQQDNARKEQA